MSFMKNFHYVCVMNPIVNLYAQQANGEYLSLESSLPSPCYKVAPLPSTESRLGFKLNQDTLIIIHELIVTI